jgi:hypothetical protein
MTHIPKIIEYLNAQIADAKRIKFDLQYKDNWSQHDYKLDSECSHTINNMPDWIAELESSLVKVDASGMTDDLVGGYVEGKDE